MKKTNVNQHKRQTVPFGTFFVAKSEYIKKNIRYFRLISSGYENNLVNLCAYYSNKHLLTQEENNKRKRFFDECYQENCFSSRWTGD